MVPGEQHEKLIGIIDYGMGNLRSVQNALVSLEGRTRLVLQPDQFHDITHLVLPGVGSFAKAMDNLETRGLIEPILEFARSGKPFLGICLGMQLMATCGYEPYKKSGLDLIPGEVLRMEAPGMRIPHVGWNALRHETSHPLFEGIKSQVDFYFVHSYYFKAARPENVLAYTDYGGEFPSIVGQGNIIGMQFHPEKSQKHGLRLLANFLNT